MLFLPIHKKGLILKIFVVLSRVPFPLEKGDKLRAYNQLKILSERHDIYLFALNDKSLHPEAMQELSSFCTQVKIFKLHKLSILCNMLKFFFKGLPIQCGYFFNNRYKKRINEAIDEIKPDVIYSQLIRTAEYVRHRKEKKVLDYQDVFSKGMYRMMQKSTFLKRWLCKMEYNRLRKYEVDVFADFDEKTIITQVDRTMIEHYAASEIVVVPNGVDSTYFVPQHVEKKYDIIFTGNMSYLPNIVACEYIAHEILPELLKREPHIKIALCGVDPSPRVLALKGEHIEVTGWVEDIRSYYAMSKLFVAPMEIGTGLQNKLLEAMAMCIPCITSPLASQPIKAVINKEIIVCNSVLGYVDEIVNLLHNQQLYEMLSQNACCYVKEHYNWQQTTKILENLLEKLNNKC